MFHRLKELKSFNNFLFPQMQEFFDIEEFLLNGETETHAQQQSLLRRVIYVGGMFSRYFFNIHLVHMITLLGARTRYQSNRSAMSRLPTELIRTHLKPMLEYTNGDVLLRFWRRVFFLENI